jgi:hypothetical protein
MNNLEQSDELGVKSRPPRFLFALIILTWTYTGLNVMSSIFTLLMGKPSVEEIKQSKVALATSVNQMLELKMYYLASLMQKIQYLTDAMYANFIGFHLVSLSVSVIGSVAALFMFQGKRLGFHLYIVYSLVYLAQTYLFVNPAFVPTETLIINAFFAFIFILMYSRNLTFMKK